MVKLMMVPELMYEMLAGEVRLMRGDKESMFMVVDALELLRFPALSMR